MKQNIYFKNAEDLKKKTLELIDDNKIFTINGYLISIEVQDNVRITCKCRSGIKTKDIWIDAFFMEDIVKIIYKDIDINDLMGEEGRIIKVEILE